MILESIKTFIATYDGLDAALALYTDRTDSDPSYSIDATPAKTVKKYTDGSQLIEFPFIFSCVASTADETARTANNDFFEDFSNWLDDQTAAGNLPVLTAPCSSQMIEAVNFGYLFETDASGDIGDYQIQCKLTYLKEV